MLLQEALEQLKNGARLYRPTWQVLDGYITLMPGMKHVWKIVLQPQVNAGNYIFSFEDLMASDWEHFVPEEEKVTEVDVEL